MGNDAKVIYNTHTLRFQQYFMHMKSFGTQEFNLNIDHIGNFAVNQGIHNFTFLKEIFHFYFPKLFSCQSMGFRLSNALSIIKLSFEHAEIHDFEF